MDQQVPSIGRIVHYRLCDGDVSVINHDRAVKGNIGNSVSAGMVFPMMITRVWTDKPNPTDAVQGQVFLDGNDTLWKTSVSVGEEVGSFSWPVRG